MPNPAAALETLTPIVEQRTVEDGFISTVQPAPAAFGEPVFVIVPEHSTEVPLGPCEWAALHGSTLPAQGAACQVAFGGREVPRVVWWEGPYAGTVPSPESITETELNTALKAKLADSGWIAVTFKNSWKNNGGASQTVAYRKQGTTVRLRGLATTGSSGTVVFGLPEHYRPTAEEVYDAGAEGERLVVVTAAGAVEAYATGYANFSGITFTTD